MKLVASISALVMAAGLLALQVIAAVEYTEGGTLYARASMIAALLTVAALPVFIEAARHINKAIGVALFVAFVSMLGYSLPAQIGRAGEVKASKAVGSEIAEQVREDLKLTKQRLQWATNDWQSECATGNGPLCKSKGQTVKALQARADELTGKVATAPAGDVSSEYLAWASAGTVSAETMRRLPVLLFVVGLDMSIWALIWLAVQGFQQARPSQTVRPTVSEPVKALDWTDAEKLTPDQMEELRKLFLGIGHPLNNNQVAALLGCQKGNASKVVSRAVAAGVLVRRRVGREVAISATVH